MAKDTRLRKLLKKNLGGWRDRTWPWERRKYDINAIKQSMSNKVRVGRRN